MQGKDTKEGKALWRKLQASVVNGNWNWHDNNPCLPKFLYQVFAKLMHRQDLASKGQMQTDINRYWLTKGFSTYEQNYCQKCLVCATHNIDSGQQMPVSAPPNMPFDHLKMDFIELTLSEGTIFILL